MKIRLPGRERRWVHVSFKIMCILAILIAIIIVGYGLPDILEFPLAIITVGSYALYAWWNQHHKEKK